MNNNLYKRNNCSINNNNMQIYQPVMLMIVSCANHVIGFEFFR